MIKKIFGTFGTRLLNALVGFVTLWFGTNFLGREAWGIGATVLVDVSLLLIAVELQRPFFATFGNSEQSMMGQNYLKSQGNISKLWYMATEHSKIL